MHHVSIQVRSHTHPSLKMCISTPSMFSPNPSRSLDSHITYIQVAFQLNPGPNICISHPSRWCITSFLVQKIASQLHPGHISRSSRFKVVCHTSIQVLSHLHPGPNNLISPPSMSQHHPGPKLHVSPAFISRHTCIQVIIFAHSSIHILSQPNPGVHISVWTPSRSRLTSSQVPSHSI